MQKRETSGNSASEMPRGQKDVVRSNVKPAPNVHPRQPLKPMRLWSDYDEHSVKKPKQLNVQPMKQPSEKQTVGTDRWCTQRQRAHR